MLQNYIIKYDGKEAGQMQVQKVGLYYQLQCCCSFPRKDFYRIIIKHSTGSIDLGICVPEGDKYYIRTKIAANLITGDDWQPCAVDSQNKAGSIEITENASFRYLSRLRQMYYIPPYLYFKAQSPDPRDNDPIP